MCHYNLELPLAKVRKIEKSLRDKGTVKIEFEFGDINGGQYSKIKYFKRNERNEYVRCFFYNWAGHFFNFFRTPTYIYLGIDSNARDAAFYISSFTLIALVDKVPSDD